MRQRERDREYLAACKAAGIAPELPRYVADHQAVELEAIDRASSDHGARHNGSNYRTERLEPEPLDPLKPEAVAALKLLDVIIPVKSDIRSFVQTAGRRVLVLCWMLGRRPEPLAELARQLNISRASLSTYARQLEDRTGLHSRGQKGARTRSIYADNARKSWKLRRLNSMMADASGEKKDVSGARTC
jgi:biotin operon repressor